MASVRRFFMIALSSFMFAVSMDVSIAGYISERMFEPHHTIGRGLLQMEKNCPVDFEFKNYTIITNECKGPRYPPDRCCDAFKKFACPYADALNDLTNNCASTMFNYINLAGSYPPGLFANECTGDKKGLPCNATYTQNNQVSANSTNDAHVVYCFSLFFVLMVSILPFIL